MLGLERGTVRLAPYTPEWHRLFEEERRSIEEAVGAYALAVEHVGSTSIPGLTAKPIIDIMLGVGELSEVEHCISPLVRLGYVYKGENGLPERHFFAKGEPRTHHIHLVQIDGAHWREHLLFRDYLRRHPSLAEEYAALKRRLAQQYHADRATYTDAKTPFITRVLELAAAHQNQP
jgi:GrpB-like predicted nucleotidyltransferase (UPF0157 family)